MAVGAIRSSPLADQEVQYSQRRTLSVPRPVDRRSACCEGATLLNFCRWRMDRLKPPKVTPSPA